MHGDWIVRGYSATCPKCKSERWFEVYLEDYDLITDMDMHFCPMCGERLDGEKSNLVEVVRCKDCKRVQRDVLFDEYRCRGHLVSPNCYCSEGIRKGE